MVLQLWAGTTTDTNSSSQQQISLEQPQGPHPSYHSAEQSRGLHIRANQANTNGMTGPSPASGGLTPSSPEKKQQSGGGGGGAGGDKEKRQPHQHRKGLLGIKSPFKFINGNMSFGKSASKKNRPASDAAQEAAAPSNGSEVALSDAVTAEKLLHSRQTNGSVTATKTTVGCNNKGGESDTCAVCRQKLCDGQALMALDKQYHMWCFKCNACGSLLQGEYMGKDGQPFCEKDYHKKFGVKCVYCLRYISGKVLQAGDNHFHPTCARCTKCGDPFGDGEEMFLQGAAIWHPRCGPGPDESGHGLADVDRFNTNASMFEDQTDVNSMASAPFYGSRASSPGASLKKDYGSGRFSRSTTHVPGWSSHCSTIGLYSASSTYSLRRPLEPGDRLDSLANINHFHLPPSRRSSSISRYASATPHPYSVASADLSHQGPYRAATCPPKPGYTQARSRTPGGLGYGSAISPGPGMHFNDYSTADDTISQQSFRTDCTEQSMSSRPVRHPPIAALPSRPRTPAAFAGEHKTHPLHTLLTTNYRLPTDIDRCNLEKHLSDIDFEFAFGMPRPEFYAMPTWRRNELKKRAHLF